MVKIINETNLIYIATEASNFARHIVVQMAKNIFGFMEPAVPPSQDHQWTLNRIY